MPLSKKAHLSLSKIRIHFYLFFTFHIDRHTMKEALEKNEVLVFRGLGTFERRETKRKEGRNPRTGEAIKMTPKKFIKFKVGKDLEDRLNAPSKKGRKKTK